MSSDCRAEILSEGGTRDTTRPYIHKVGQTASITELSLTPPPPLPIPRMGASYGPHDGVCLGTRCHLCYKYSCVLCGERSNRIFAPCWNCGSTEGNATNSDQNN